MTSSDGKTIGPLLGQPREALPAPCKDWPALLVFGVLILIIIITGQLPGSPYSTESVHRTMVARDLLAGLSRGRQGLVGSPALAPLPTIIVTFLALIPFIKLTAICGAILAGIATLLLCLYLNRSWAREGISPWLRYPSIVCLLFLPPVTLSIQFGQTTMLFVTLVVCGWGFLTRWLREFALRDLAYAALLLGLSVGVRYQAIFLVALAFVLVIVAVTTEHRSLSLMEGTAVTFLVPTVYIVLLWIGGNWLILGNPVFFLRGLFHSISIGTADLRAILVTNCEWLVLGAVGLLTLSVPGVSMLARSESGGKLRHVTAFCALLLAVSIVLATGASSGIRTTDPRISRAVAQLEIKYPNGSFIVTGYEGYEFVHAAGSRPEEYWIHLMHLESEKLDKVLHDYRGREVYLLINTERTVERWEDVGLEWRGQYGRIPEHFIYVDQVGPWVMFEVIRQEEGLLLGSAG